MENKDIQLSATEPVKKRRGNPNFIKGQKNIYYKDNLKDISNIEEDNSIEGVQNSINGERTDLNQSNLANLGNRHAGDICQERRIIKTKRIKDIMFILNRFIKALKTKDLDKQSAFQLTSSVDKIMDKLLLLSEQETKNEAPHPYYIFQSYEEEKNLERIKELEAKIKELEKCNDVTRGDIIPLPTIK